MTEQNSKNEKQLKESLFHLWANSIPFWGAKGRDLKRSADLILKNNGSNDIYMMLIAFSLENFLKGIIISDEFEKPTLKKWKGLSHDLVNLFNKCGISISEAEKSILERLTNYSTWRGRYPVPTTPDGFPEIYESSDGRIMPKVYFETFSDPQIIEKLVELLEIKLEQKIEEIQKKTKT